MTPVLGGRPYRSLATAQIGIMLVGVFAAARVTKAGIRRQYQVEVIGQLEGPVERFYAISVERRLKHPAVLAISSAAREELFPIRPRPGEPPTGKGGPVGEADAPGIDPGPGEEP